MLRAVTFDWWHTLAEPIAEGLGEGEYGERTKALRLAGVTSVFAGEGIEVEPTRLSEAYDGQLARMRQVWSGHVDLSADDQLRLFLDLLGIDKADLIGKLKGPYGRALLQAPPWIDPEARRVFAELRARGLRVGLISNTGRSWGTVLRTVMAKHGLLELFDVLTFSDEAGVRKPAAAIFERTLAGLGVPAAAVLHVGDDPEADAAGCLAVGMKAAWLRRGPVAREAKGSPADLWIDSLPELLDHLDGL